MGPTEDQNRGFWIQRPLGFHDLLRDGTVLAEDLASLRKWSLGIPIDHDQFTYIQNVFVTKQGPVRAPPIDKQGVLIILVFKEEGLLLSDQIDAIEVGRKPESFFGLDLIQKIEIFAIIRNLDEAEIFFRIQDRKARLFGMILLRFPDPPKHDDPEAGK